MANPTRSGDRRRAPASGQAGYTLAALAVAVTVLTILLGLALPVWSKAIQREKEEELIGRGLQYAEAIRVFRARFNRSPMRLEELLEVKPRSIRQLWKDPMTEDGKWAIVFEAQGGAGPGGRPPQGPPGTGGQRSGQPQVQGFGAVGEGDQEGRIDVPQVGPDGRPVQTFGPIAGVHSLSDKEGIHVWNGKEKISEWVFDYTLLTTGGQPFGVPNAQGGGGINPFALHAAWIGRPFRKGIVPPGQAPGDAGGPGGVPGGVLGGAFGGGKPGQGPAAGKPLGGGLGGGGTGGGKPGLGPDGEEDG